MRHDGVVRTSGGGSDSRWAGVFVLELAVVMMLAVSWFSAEPLGKRASRAPLPEPPTVGSCLRVGTTVDRVPCGGDHDAEVVASWRADDPLVLAVSTFSGYLQRQFEGPDRSMGGLPDEIVEKCWSAAAGYVRPAATASQEDWLPVSPTVQPAIIAAPADEGTGRWRWLSCVAVAIDDRSWSGSLRWQSDQPTLRPAALAASCGNDDTGPQIRCDRKHRWEVLGWPGRATGSTSDQLVDSCLLLAAQLTGRSDPTFGGQIDIRVITQLPVPRTSALPICVATVRGERDLVGSLIGIGGAGLPLQ